MELYKLVAVLNAGSMIVGIIEKMNGISITKKYTVSDNYIYILTVTR